MEKVSEQTAEQYTWGNHCDGWHLVKTDTLSVIQERMPPNTSEALHVHHKAQQFFYVLDGVATFDVEGEIIHVKANEGVHIKPNQRHKISNHGADNLHFLVISEPKSHGDRTTITE
ncbi:cupin domain-containing protein [Spirosoma fluminis]